MGKLGTFGLTPFPWPRKPLDPKSPDQIRGELNQLAKNLTGHDADAALHTVTSSTASVTTSAKAIYVAVTGLAFALVAGDNGAGKTFVDQIAWNGTTNVVAVVSSTTVDGAPDARTYTVASHILKLTMAGGSYTIVIAPTLLS